MCKHVLFPCAGGGSAAAAAPAVPHPVWGVAEPAVSGYIQLLQLLCGEELARLRVWTEPLKHGDAAKTTTAVRPVLSTNALLEGLQQGPQQSCCYMLSPCSMHVLPAYPVTGATKWAAWRCQPWRQVLCATRAECCGVFLLVRGTLLSRVQEAMFLAPKLCLSMPECLPFCSLFGANADRALVFP